MKEQQFEYRATNVLAYNEDSHDRGAPPPAPVPPGPGWRLVGVAVHASWVNCYWERVVEEPPK